MKKNNIKVKTNKRNVKVNKTKKSKSNKKIIFDNFLGITFFRTKTSIALCFIIACLLLASTYAWFIAIRNVSVNPFNISIASTDGLTISMDGKRWYYTLDPKTTKPYVGNANQWLDEKDERGNPLHRGMLPVSSVGDLDFSTHRMKFYEKSSITATDGGYRILTSKIDNTSKKVPGSNEYIEGDGYIAFDLFFKNSEGKGKKYYVENDPANEEGIYLTYDSEVLPGDKGFQHSGVENSVRVAFTQIGRVKADTKDINKITSISCKDTTNGYTDSNGVTSICRKAYIWEPNDNFHVPTVVDWFNQSCRKRKNLNGFHFTDQRCNKIKTDSYIPTYPISRVFDIEDYVDIYDGIEINGSNINNIDYYSYTSSKDDSKHKLVKVPTFTDRDRDEVGVNRMPFMTLAPNSITKVRIYVYIEGQDIDNFDFSTLSKDIQINFGFSKERFVGDADPDDLNHNNPYLPSGKTCTNSYKFGGKCVSECPNGYYINGSVCVRNCKASLGKRCVDRCPYGYQNVAGICKK